MKLNVKQIEDQYELSRHFEIKFDETIDLSDYTTVGDIINALKANAVIVPGEYAEHTEIEI